ncbi:MAG: hypothetical protein IEMM0002_0022 [bacterium]|nr:MAG: hypothetical protein IEMM0002_0022 [bacterium]
MPKFENGENKRSLKKGNNQNPLVPEVVGPNSLDVSPTKETFILSAQESHVSKVALEEVRNFKETVREKEVNELKRKATWANTYKVIMVFLIGLLAGIAILIWFVVRFSNGQ